MAAKDCKSQRKVIPLSTIFREQMNFSSKVFPLHWNPEHFCAV